jgi:hypothetical protein
MMHKHLILFCVCSRKTLNWGERGNTEGVPKKDFSAIPYFLVTANYEIFFLYVAAGIVSLRYQMTGPTDRTHFKIAKTKSVLQKHKVFCQYTLCIAQKFRVIFTQVVHSTAFAAMTSVSSPFYYRSHAPPSPLPPSVLPAAATTNAISATIAAICWLIVGCPRRCLCFHRCCLPPPLPLLAANVICDGDDCDSGCGRNSNGSGGGTRDLSPG